MSKILQAVGIVIFGLSLWKGVHGFWVTLGLVGGAGLAYAAKHYDLLAAIEALKSKVHFSHILALLLCILGLAGCAAHKKPAGSYSLVYEPPCLEKVELTGCSGVDSNKCKTVKLTHKNGCEQVQVRK